jgi:hypothetical protein
MRRRPMGNEQHSLPNNMRMLLRGFSGNSFAFQLYKVISYQYLVSVLSTLVGLWHRRCLAFFLLQARNKGSFQLATALFCQPAQHVE